MAHKIKPDQWDAMLAVHCTAPFRLIQAAAPFMRDAAKKEMEATSAAARPRSILNASSTSGTHGNPGQANYATAKAGVVGLTKTVAKEWGPFNVRCNALAFGFIATRLTGDKGAASISVGGEDGAAGDPRRGGRGGRGSGDDDPSEEGWHARRRSWSDADACEPLLELHQRTDGRGDRRGVHLRNLI